MRGPVLREQLEPKPMSVGYGPLLAGLCDDAALFPPGNAPLSEAVPAHAEHGKSSHADLVGSFVFPEGRLGELAEFLAQFPYPGELVLSLTVPRPSAVMSALERAGALDAVTVAALEIVVPTECGVDELFSALDEVSALHPDIALFVEVPRDARRTAILGRLAGSPYAAKFRTGGVVAEAYPDEAELAEAITATVTAGIPFKATAGLHHAVRNTASGTGFEQHGFVNVLAAVATALDGGDTHAVSSVLAERDGAALAARLTGLPADRAAEVRARFLSYGTCSITEPLADLRVLGLVPSTDSPTSEGTPA